MTLWYDFDGEYFEYDVSYNKIEEYLMKLPNEELVDAFKKAFEDLPKEEQLTLLQERNEPNFACPNFLAWINDDKNWVVTEFIMEPSILSLFEDELHDEFEEAAYAQFSDGRSYSRDPYSYNGVSPSDFF